MEALIYNKEIPGKLNVSEKWASTFDKVEDFAISPRLELWRSPDDIFIKKDIGVFLIGCWDEKLLQSFNLSNIFKKKGSRNFHQRVLSIEDLKYCNMTDIIFNEMSKIWEFHEMNKA